MQRLLFAAVILISVHIYPESRKPESARQALEQCKVGKPVVIEETFPLSCTNEELSKFLHASRDIASGWIWHFDGYTIADYDAIEKAGKLTISQAIWRGAIKEFERLRRDFVKGE